jgi:putative membrane protein
MAIALWVGALATYLVLPAFLEPARRHRRWAGAVAGLLMGTGIGALQAVLMVAVLSLGVGIEVARLPELFAFAILVAAAAAAVTQALVALLGMRGWFVALAFLVLQLSAAGAWFPVATAPSLFGTLHPLLPMTYALEGFRTLIGGGSGSLGLAVLIQVAWIAGALGITLGVAAWRTRDGQSASAPVAA